VRAFFEAQSSPSLRPQCGNGRNPAGSICRRERISSKIRRRQRKAKLTDNYLAGRAAPISTHSSRVILADCRQPDVVGLQHYGIAVAVQSPVSAAVLIPIQAGMPAGRWLRRRINPVLFRRRILIVLAFSGVDMLRRAFV
jgi:hypothetical protein